MSKLHVLVVRPFSNTAYTCIYGYVQAVAAPGGTGGTSPPPKPEKIPKGWDQLPQQPAP